MVRALLSSRSNCISTSKLQRRIGICRVATLQPPTTSPTSNTQQLNHQTVRHRTQQISEPAPEKVVVIQEQEQEQEREQEREQEVNDPFPGAKVSPQVLMTLLDQGNHDDTQFLLSCKQRRLRVIYSDEIAQCVDSLEIADVLFVLYDVYGTHKRLHKEEVINLRNYVKYILCMHGTKMHEVIYNIIVDVLIHHNAINTSQ